MGAGWSLVVMTMMMVVMMMTTKTWLRGGGGRPLEAGFFLPELFWVDFQNQASGIKQAGQFFFLKRYFPKSGPAAEGDLPIHRSAQSRLKSSKEGKFLVAS